MTNSIICTFAAIGIILSLSACSMVDDPPAPFLGVIVWDGPSHAVVGATPAVSAEPGDGYSDFDPLQIPDVVQAGQPFTATVTSISANSCWVRDSEAVDYKPASIHITVFDRILASEACLDVYGTNVRELELVLNEPGDYEVTLFGRYVEGEEWHVVHETSVTRTVTVE